MRHARILGMLVAALAALTALALGLASSEHGLAIAGDAAPPAYKPIAQGEYASLSWEVSPSIEFRDKIELPLGRQVATLDAPKDTTIAVVSITLHVPAALLGTRDLPLEPGRFLARHTGYLVSAKAAGLEVGSGPQSVLWFMNNTNQDFNVHLSEPTKRLKVVFGVPKDWKDVDVLFASPIGSTKAPAK